MRASIREGCKRREDEDEDEDEEEKGEGGKGVRKIKISNPK